MCAKRIELNYCKTCTLQMISIIIIIIIIVIRAVAGVRLPVRGRVVVLVDQTRPSPAAESSCNTSAWSLFGGRPDDHDLRG